MLWQDLQEAFYIIFGPYIVGFILPVFVTLGLLLAILMTVSKYWRPKERVEAVIKSRDES